MSVKLRQLGGALIAGAMLAGMTVSVADAQTRIKTMPGYDTYTAMAGKIAGSVRQAAITPDWADNSRSFTYMLDGVRYRYDVGTRKAVEAPLPPQPAAERTARAFTGGVVLARGRGGDTDKTSPDGKYRAFTRDMNLYVQPTGGAEIAVTTDGSKQSRIRNGVGSYVYLEEFSVSAPVYWSPDSKKVAFYRYDESKVDDYFLALDQTKLFSKVLEEVYPHPGRNNPIADLVVYDVATGKKTTMDVRGGQPFGNDVVGHYAWQGQWINGGTEILIRRADRRQHVYDVAACSAATGACRTVVRETRPNAWASGSPMTFLKDGKRFIWESERTDFGNLYLYDLSGREIAQLTKHAFDVGEVVKVDEAAGYVFYMARSGDNYMKMQLHRVKLDGTGDVRLTDPSLNHRVNISPDNKFIVDVAQTHDKAPVSRLLDGQGKVLATIASSNTTQFDALKLKTAELFTFTAADGQTQLHGLLQFPSFFDPARQYPMLVSVYGGPNTNGAAETFQNAQGLAEYGFIYLRLDARSASGKGRKALDSIYQQLGVAEMDDIAAGIRAAASRPYVDKTRVGIYGTSYGGTTAATVLLRHPDAVQAAVSNSPVTDYRLYDTAYAERFLGLPDTDKAAYDRAAVLTYAADLKGDLMIYFGTSDDNVHPKNALQLIKALQDAGKSFEVQVGPDKGHTAVSTDRMMEFFIQKLVIDRPASGSRSAQPG